MVKIALHPNPSIYSDLCLPLAFCTYCSLWQNEIEAMLFDTGKHFLLVKF